MHARATCTSTYFPTFKLQPQTTVNFLPWSCGHDWTARLRAELCNGPVQHVDLVEEIHGWKGNVSSVLKVQNTKPTEHRFTLIQLTQPLRITVTGVNALQNSAKTNIPLPYDVTWLMTSRHFDHLGILMALSIFIVWLLPLINLYSVKLHLAFPTLAMTALGSI